MANSTETEIDKATCSFCLDIFQSPMRISCGHTFCKSCLDPYAHIVNPKCPLCRIPFDISSRLPDENMNRFIQTQKAPCPGCNKQMLLVQLKAHSIYCPDVLESVGSLSVSVVKVADDVHEPVTPVRMRSSNRSNANSARAATQTRGVDGSNRSTFQCPFCHQRNFDTAALLLHCTSIHARENQKVVCPICASKSWGNPQQKSQHFLDHMNLRHDDDDSLGATAQPRSVSTPNRSTFQCPFCHQRNFDTDGLLQHCTANHAQQNQKLVCPICAAMPWGDPQQRSDNLLEHIKLRHKFEYERYVDFHKTEDEMLGTAIQKSYKY